MMPIVFVGGADKNTQHGKGLQLYFNDHPVLVVSPDLFRHDDALVEFLTNRDIHFTDQQAYDIPNHWRPQVKGEQYHLVGVGWARIHPEAIVLDAGSDRYHLVPCKKHAKEITQILGTRTVSVKHVFSLLGDRANY